MASANTVETEIQKTTNETADIKTNEDLKILNGRDTFLISSSNEFLINHYKNYKKKYDTDSGIDLLCPFDVVIPPFSEVCAAAEEKDSKTKYYTEVNLEIQTQLLSRDNIPRGYFLLPRSSISDTPLQLANTVGLFDWLYRGNAIARVRNHSNKPYKILKGTKLFQLCTSDLSPANLQFKAKLEETARGSKGFGSTNKN